MNTKQPFYTTGEEIGNAVSHGVGGALGIWGLVMLILKCTDAWQVTACCIYGASIIILFTMSCLYHSLTNKTAKYVMRVFDHTSIFLLIAGTYTPYTLVTLRGALGWVLFGVVWAATIVGITLNAVSIEKFKVFSMICYIASGWCVIFAIYPLLQKLETTGFWLLLGGGVAYTLGLIFYRSDKKWQHMIWHFFVLAAAILHFLSIYGYVIG